MILNNSKMMNPLICCVVGGSGEAGMGPGGGSGNVGVGGGGGGPDFAGDFSGSRGNVGASPSPSDGSRGNVSSVPPGANPVASGDPTSQGFGGTTTGGSVGEGNQGLAASFAVGKSIGKDVLVGNMTADQANTAIASANLGLIGTIAANSGAITGSTPSALASGLSIVGLPITGAFGLAALGAALTGQGVLGATPDGSVDGGPDFNNLVTQGQQYADTNNIDINEVVASTGASSIINPTEDPSSVASSDPFEGDLWNQFVDRAVNDLEGLTQENADFRRTEAEQYNQTIGTATAKDNSVLSGLASDLNNETGTFTPTQTNWGTYQPGSNFIKSKALTGFSSAEKDNTINAAKSKYGTVSDRSPVIGTLQYLAGLEGIATTDRESLMQKYINDLQAETTRYSTDLNAESSKYAVDNNVSMNNLTIAANEPGVLDNIVSGVNAGVGIMDMGKTFGWWV